MNLTLTLKTNEKLIFTNSHNAVFNITHMSKMCNKSKGVLYINKNNEKFEVAKIKSCSIKVNLYIFIDTNNKDIFSLECSGCVIDIFGVYEYEENDLPFTPYIILQNTEKKNIITSGESDSENFENDNKDSVSLEALIKNSKKKNEEISKGFSLTNIHKSNKNKNKI